MEKRRVIRNWLMAAAVMGATALAIGCGGNGDVDTDTGATDEGGVDTVIADTGSTDTGERDEGGVDTVTAGHPHDYWTGVDWDTFFPGAGDSAMYHVTTFSSVEMNLEAHVVEGVEFKGGTWTQIVVGDLEPGHDGSAIYFDKSTPWVIKAKGVEVYSTDVTEGPLMTEWFDDTLDIPLNKNIGEVTTVNTQINGDYNGYTAKMDVSYAIEWESFDSEVTVAAGTYTGCAVLKATLGDELIGDTPLVVRLKLHPEQKIIWWEDSPGFMMAELQSEWE